MLTKNASEPRALGAKVTSQVMTTSALQGGALVIDLMFTAILSRLLSPADYGTVAAAMLFLALCDLFREIGIGTTIIQMPKLSLIDQRTGFTLVLLTAFAMFAASQLLAPFFADFMGMPQLSVVVRVLSIIIVIQAFSSIAQGLLLRELKVRYVMGSEIAAKFLAYATLGIGMAWAGYGYWALVAASLLEALLRSILFTAFARPSLMPHLDRESARRLLGTGSGFAASRIINFIALRADVTVVGRYMDAASLGLYSRAYKLMNMPTDLYSKVADRVVFPAMAKVQGEPARLKAAYLRGMSLTSLFGLPLTVVVFALAPEIIEVLLGHKWMGVVPVFSVLAIGTYFRLSARVSGSLLRATASIRDLVLGQVVYATLTVGGSLYAVQYGLPAVGAAIGLAIFGWFALITFQACRAASVSPGELLRSHKHGLLLAILTGVATFAVVLAGRHVGMAPILILAAAGCVLAVIGILMLVKKPSFLLGQDGMQFALHAQGALLKLRR